MAVGRVVLRLMRASRLHGRSLANIRTVVLLCVTSSVLLICWLLFGRSSWIWPSGTQLDGWLHPATLKKSFVTDVDGVTNARIAVKVNPLEPNADFGEKLDDLLSTVSVTCGRLLSVPATTKHISTGSGGLNFPSPVASRWPICLDHLQSTNCIVYSAKIGGSDEFEEAVSRLGCEVFLFDPSLNEEDVRQIERKGIRAFSWGLGTVNATIATGVKKLKSKGEIIQSSDDDDGKWRYIKAGEVIHELGHSARTVDVLRLDLHGGEWDALLSLATAGTLSNVRQIVAATHVWHGESVFSLIDRFMRSEKLVASGYQIFHTEPMIDLGLESEQQKCCRVIGWLLRMNSAAS